MLEGKLQSHNYFVSQLSINKTGFHFPVADENYLAGLRHIIRKQLPEVASLAGLNYPKFDLMSFKNEKFVSNKMEGKVMLLDFWEV